MQAGYKENNRNYEVVGKLIEELKLRKYSYRTGRDTENEIADCITSNTNLF